MPRIPLLPSITACLRYTHASPLDRNTSTPLGNESIQPKPTYIAHPAHNSKTPAPRDETKKNCPCAKASFSVEKRERERSKETRRVINNLFISARLSSKSILYFLLVDTRVDPLCSTRDRHTKDAHDAGWLAGWLVALVHIYILPAARAIKGAGSEREKLLLPRYVTGLPTSHAGAVGKTCARARAARRGHPSPSSNWLSLPKIQASSVRAARRRKNVYLYWWGSLYFFVAVGWCDKKCSEALRVLSCGRGIGGFVPGWAVGSGDGVVERALLFLLSDSKAWGFKRCIQNEKKEVGI